MSFAGRSLVALLLLFTASAARAQQPGAEAPMPLAVDLAKVPLGSWADYTMSVGTMPPMTARMALVARKGASHTIEMAVTGGAVAMTGGAMVVQTVIDDSAKNGSPTVERLIMQLGANDPMEMPPDAARERRFKRPDPKTLVGSETLKLAGGSYKTKHYRDKTPSGDRVDYWITDSVLPLGLVKMEAEQKAIPGALVKVELKGRGKDAKQAITKAPRPFDEEKFRQQVMAGAAGAAQPAPQSKK